MRFQCRPLNRTSSSIVCKSVDDAKFEMSIDLLAEDDMIKRPPDCSLDFPTRTDNKRRKVDSKKLQHRIPGRGIRKETLLSTGAIRVTTPHSASDTGE